MVVDERPQIAREAAARLLDAEDRACVVDRRGGLQPIADDARVPQQTIDIGGAEPGNRRRIEAGEGGSVALALVGIVGQGKARRAPSGARRPEKGRASPGGVPPPSSWEGASR